MGVPVMQKGRVMASPVYRRTICERCEQVKSDCIWVAVPSRDHQERCLCGDCRRRIRESGRDLVNIDVDFPSVAA